MADKYYLPGNPYPLGSSEGVGHAIGSAFRENLDAMQEMQAEQQRQAAVARRKAKMQDKIREYEAAIAKWEIALTNMKKLSNHNAAHATAFRRTAYKLGKQLGLSKEQVAADFREQLPNAVEALEEHMKKINETALRVDI